ncbi:MAG: hypothetical protein IT539_17860 [Bradyrhizobiaceae bacterium]|nr:hypothetical protein [Bradyrhizobiaceae bacterium]
MEAIVPANACRRFGAAPTAKKKRRAGFAMRPTVWRARRLECFIVPAPRRICVPRNRGTDGLEGAVGRAAPHDYQIPRMAA